MSDKIAWITGIACGILLFGVGMLIADRTPSKCELNEAAIQAYTLCAENPDSCLMTANDVVLYSKAWVYKRQVCQ